MASQIDKWAKEYTGKEDNTGDEIEVDHTVDVYTNIKTGDTLQINGHTYTWRFVNNDGSFDNCAIYSLSIKGSTWEANALNKYAMAASGTLHGCDTVYSIYENGSYAFDTGGMIGQSGGLTTATYTVTSTGATGGDVTISGHRHSGDIVWGSPDKKLKPNNDYNIDIIDDIDYSIRPRNGFIAQTTGIKAASVDIGEEYKNALVNETINEMKKKSTLKLFYNCSDETKAIIANSRCYEEK